MTLAEDVARKLLLATSLPDEKVFFEKTIPMNTVVDYYRIACNVLFVCEKCGTCCTTGNPIRLREEDIKRISKHLKIPLNKAVKKYTIPDPNRQGTLNFKNILPCKFYDPALCTCKIYMARPWSCRIFPFIGIYGSDKEVKVHEACKGSVKSVKALTDAIEKIRFETDSNASKTPQLEMVKLAKQWFKDALNSVI